jgi:ribose transport system permease protein
MTMIVVSGGIDLSVGSVVALSTVVTALLLPPDAGAGSALVALIGAVAVGALCGALNGCSSRSCASCRSS